MSSFYKNSTFMPLKIVSNKICYHKRWQNVLKSSFFITGFEVYIHTPPVQNSPTALLTLSSPPFPKQYPLPGDSYNDKQNQASIKKYAQCLILSLFRSNCSFNIRKQANHESPPHKHSQNFH